MELERSSASPSNEIVICLRGFISLKNTKANIKRHFVAQGFQVGEIYFEKEPRKRGESHIAVVPLTGKNLESVFRKRVICINKRNVRVERLNTKTVDSNLSNLSPMVTKLPPRPEHEMSCPVKRLTCDAWYHVSRYLGDNDLRALGGVCSCCYRLVRHFDRCERQSLSLNTRDFVRYKYLWDLSCSYRHIQRYLLRYNLAGLQCLHLDLSPFELKPLPWDFFNFFSFYCPQLGHLHVEKLTWMTPRQRLGSRLSFQNLTVLEVLCASAPQIDSDGILAAEALEDVIRSANRLLRLKLSECVFRKSFFNILPPGLQSLEVAGSFYGLPSEALVARFKALQHLSMSVSQKRLPRADAAAPPACILAVLQLPQSRCAVDPPTAWSNLQRLELHKPLDFTQDTVRTISAACPQLQFLLLRRRAGTVAHNLDLRPLARLQELRLPQRLVFEVLTGRLPPSLRLLQIHMRQHMVVGTPETDNWRLPVHQYFEFLLTLPRLEYLEIGAVFYPNRAFLTNILSARRRLPFLTIAQSTLLVPSDVEEIVGDSFRFLRMDPGRIDKAVQAGLMLHRDVRAQR